MKYIAIIITLTFLLIGCSNDELDPIPANLILDNPGLELFEITETTVQEIDFLERKLTVRFNSIYSELPIEQQEHIRCIDLSGDRDSCFDPDRLSFTSSGIFAGSTFCFDLAFRSVNDDLSRATSHCVEIQ